MNKFRGGWGVGEWVEVEARAGERGKQQRDKRVESGRGEGEAGWRGGLEKDTARRVRGAGITADRSCRTHVVVAGPREALYLEYLGDFEEARDVFLLDVDFALVHEVQHRRQVSIVDILEDDDGMFTRVPLQRERTHNRFDTSDSQVGEAAIAAVGALLRGRVTAGGGGRRR
jgi:hypothetical protein